MDLILWRHAEAEPGDPDESRALTPKGHKQAWKMGEWLDRNLPNSCRILVSPTRRTVQTAEALGRRFKIVPGLGPEAYPEAILEIANWPDSREPVLIVGHQPTLGQATALIISGNPQDWMVRKGSAVWISQKDRGESAETYMKAILAPELIGK